MLHCLPKHPTPCYHYCGDKFALSAFVADNGGTSAIQFIGDTAIISSNYRGDVRQVTLYPTSWVRVILPGQFSAVNDVRFSESFRLVKDTSLQEAVDTYHQLRQMEFAKRKASIWAKICKALGWD